MDHPYKNGYSTLPALKKLEGSPFLKDETLVKIRQEAAKTQKVFFEHDIDESVYAPICAYIAQESQQELKNFPEMAVNLAEDVIVHRMRGTQDWMAAGFICLPSGWWPEEKIGQPLSKIHEPIPGMKLDQSRKLVETMINHGPFYRFVWSVVFEEKVNFHPSVPKKKFDGKVWVKIERQMTIGFPEIQSALFVLRQGLIQPEEIDYEGLYQACSNMNEAERIYKNISDDVLNYLYGKIS